MILQQERLKRTYDKLGRTGHPTKSSRSVSKQSSQPWRNTFMLIIRWMYSLIPKVLRNLKVDKQQDAPWALKKLNCDAEL